MTNNYTKLQDVLREVFQLDKADLDFGIYRIMNQKRKDIEQFLLEELPAQVRKVLEQHNSGDTQAFKKELQDTVDQLKDLGVDPSTSAKVQELKAKIENGVSIDALEQEVFSHLASFFKRYYKDGDFISLRRYKKDVYAIPYEGEEVKLHWANHDQYYIKTSEYLKNYGFKLDGGKTVKFELKEAGTEQNNNKTQKNLERRFALYEEEPVNVDGNTLSINFTFELHKKTEKQDQLLEKAIKVLSGKIPAEFQGVFVLKPTEKKKQRTLLEKHLYDYTARNTFDYFIHKDLGGFLRRELDFYIKNEVLYIDDINTDNEIAFSSQISKIKALKQVAEKIILFLEQLENFQKKLWLKKKFVVSANYCITLDRIPEEYYPEIFENKAQLEEWEKLFNVSPKKVEDLVAEPFLVLDTKFFAQEFKDNLISEYDNLDESWNGLLINSENFQALNLLEEKYLGSVDYNYIDPPYNTDSAPILYKNDYKKSSWLSLLSDRMQIAKRLLNTKAVKTIAIDDTEISNLSILCNQLYPNYRQSRVTVVHNPKGSITKDFNRVHEYAIFLTPEVEKKVIERTLTENDKPRKMRRWGENSLRTERRLSFYPIIIKDGKIVEIGEVPGDDFHPESKNIHLEDSRIAVYPIDQDGIERRWNFGLDSIKDNLDRIKVIEINGLYDLFVTHEKNVPKTVWNGGEYDAGNYGNTLLISILGVKIFDFPKSINLVLNSLKITTKSLPNALILDYFAGSGTTGHATIKLNRDGGNRKYILIEMGEYFDSVTKPRIQKVIYSDNWRNGKPQDKKGISQMFKYMSLEGFEDSLNNLELKQEQSQQNLLSGHKDVREEYLLKYMLDVESRGHLFDLKAFKNPFNYQLNITENNELVSTPVDLVETFNYLIGLHVKRIQRIGAFKTVEGTTNSGEKVLVIWRNLEETNNDDLDKFVQRTGINVMDGEFDTIYVNGDNNLANLRKEEERWKVRLTEEVFFAEMFDVQDI